MHKCIGIIHLFAMIMEDIYGFIIRKNIILDKLYIIGFVSIPCTWIICKDECIISYVMKKIENNNYILGDEPEDAKDIRDLFINKQQYLIFYHINNLLRIFSVLVVNERTTNIHSMIFIPTCLLYLLYTYDISYKLNYRKKFDPFFQIILGVYFFTCMFKALNSLLH